MPPVKETFESEETLEVITHVRGLKSILAILEDWTLCEDGLKCTPCGVTLKYNHLTEDAF